MQHDMRQNTFDPARRSPTAAVSFLKANFVRVISSQNFWLSLRFQTAQTNYRMGKKKKQLGNENNGEEFLILDAIPSTEVRRDVDKEMWRPHVKLQLGQGCHNLGWEDVNMFSWQLRSKGPLAHEEKVFFSSTVVLDYAKTNARTMHLAFIRLKRRRSMNK